jgi:hypothetical protein
MINHIVRLSTIFAEKEDGLDYKKYYDLSSRVIMLFMQAQKAAMNNDKAEIYYCIVEIDFLWDEICDNYLEKEGKTVDKLAEFIVGMKYLLLQRKPTCAEALTFVTYGGAKSTRQQAEELKRDIQVAEEDIDYQKNKEQWEALEREQRWKKEEDDDARRPHIL